MNEEDHHKIKCPSCGYERTEKDDGYFSKEECPKCGIYYKKHVDKKAADQINTNQDKKLNKESVPPADSGIPAETIREDVVYEGNRERLDTSSKSFSINQNQKRIMVAVIAVFVAMIAYPPFHVVYRNGTVFNMGYGWIFDPPSRGLPATVNISMLLIQWIGVLVVGGIAFFLTKGASLPPVSSPQQSTVASPPIEKPKGNESGKFLGGNHHPWRRFFARTVDVSTLGLLAFFVLAFAVGLLFPDNYESFAKALENKIIAGFIGLALWIPIEAVLLSTAGNTPGKWLFGISVRTTSGHILTFSQALERSFRVFVQGLGLGIIPVPLFTEIFAYKRLTKTGTTLWDTATECVVTHETWGTARTVICVAVVLFVLVCGSLLNLTEKKGFFSSKPKADTEDEMVNNYIAKKYGSEPEESKNPFKVPKEAPAPAPAPATGAPGPGPAPAPGSAEDWFDKAFTLCRNPPCTDPHKAIEYLNEAIRLRPDYADAHSIRAEAYEDLGQYQLAIRDYDEAIRLKPHDTFNYSLRGLAYMQLGNREQGCRSLTRPVNWETANNTK